MVITAFNPDTTDLERSFLDLSSSAGATSLTVKNADRFIATDRIMIGEMGREKTEIVTLSATSGGNTLTVGAAVFPHSADDPVYRLRFDQVRFYRSTTGSAGAFSLVDTENLDVDNENLTTIYDDTVGLATYYYKISYYNSVTTVESTLSDPVLGAGYPRGSVGFLIDELLREVGDTNEQFVSRGEILGWFNEVNDDLQTRRKRPYSFLHTRAAYSRTANNASGAGTYLAFPTDMWKFDFLEYNFIDSTTTPTTNITYPVRVISLQDYRETYQNTDFTNTLVLSDELQVIALDDALSRIRLWPWSKTSSSNVFYIYYWKTFTTIDSEADLLQTPTPKPYKLFGLYKFFNKKSMSDFTQASTAKDFFNQYNNEVVKLDRNQNKDAGSLPGFKSLPQDWKGNRKL